MAIGSARASPGISDDRMGVRTGLGGSDSTTLNCGTTLRNWSVTRAQGFVRQRVSPQTSVGLSDPLSDPDGYLLPDVQQRFDAGHTGVQRGWRTIS